MHYRLAILTALVWLIAAAPAALAQAEPAAEPLELVRLRDLYESRRENAVRDGVTALNAQYLRQLTDLEAGLTRRKDADGAQRVRQEISALTNDPYRVEAPPAPTDKKAPAQEPRELSGYRAAYLTAKHQAVKNAVGPITLAYGQQLDALLNQLTQAGDTDGARAVTREKERLQQSPKSRKNVAGEGVATASSIFSPQFAAAHAADGNPATEWASQQEPTGAWWKLTFTRLRTIDALVLRDRPNLTDQVLAARIEFSDGSSQVAGPLPNDGAPLTAPLKPAKNITWFRVVIDQGGGFNPGLSEVAAEGW